MITHYHSIDPNLLIVNSEPSNDSLVFTSATIETVLTEEDRGDDVWIESEHRLNIGFRDLYLDVSDKSRGVTSYGWFYGELEYKIQSRHLYIGDLYVDPKKRTDNWHGSRYTIYACLYYFDRKIDNKEYNKIKNEIFTETFSGCFSTDWPYDDRLIAFLNFSKSLAESGCFDKKYLFNEVMRARVLSLEAQTLHHQKWIEKAMMLRDEYATYAG